MLANAQESEPLLISPWNFSFAFFFNLLVMLKRFKHFLKIIIFIAYIHQNLVNVSNKDINNFQEMLESFKHLNEKFHGEMRSSSL